MMSGLDDSLYLEHCLDSIGRNIWYQVEDYSMIPEGKIYRSRIRKDVAESAIRSNRWRNK